MESNIKDEWFIAEGRHEGQRLLVRLNVGARPMAGDKQYPFKVGVAIPFESPQADGMPNGDELQRFARIEDMLFNRFDVEHTGVLCIIITTGGMREFVIYSKINNVSDMVEDVSLHFPAYDFQHYVEQDKKWDEFNYWIERVGK